MKYKALDMLKRKVYLADMCDELTCEEEKELSEIEVTFEELKSQLCEDDINWMYQAFAVWYDKFMDFETKMFIKPRGG